MDLFRGLSISAKSTPSLKSLRTLLRVFLYTATSLKKHAATFSSLISFASVHIHQAEFDYWIVKIFTFLLIYWRNVQQESRCKRQSILVVLQGGWFRPRLGHRECLKSFPVACTHKFRCPISNWTWAFNSTLYTTSFSYYSYTIIRRIIVWTADSVAI